MNNPHQVDRPEIIEVLDNFGKLVCSDKQEYFTYLTTSSSVEGSLLDTTLYILAPEINYEYRAINVELTSAYSLIIRFFTLATKQSEPYPVNISNGFTDYNATLFKIQNLGLFKLALEHLINQIQLKRETRTSSIRNKIIPGQARVAILKNGQRMNAGWLRIDDDEYVVYYTGQGLKEMWKPNMSLQEQQRANDLKQKAEPELIKEGMIAKTHLSDFLDIL